MLDSVSPSAASAFLPITIAARLRQHAGRALADGEPDWSFAFRINKSDHITVINSEISGTANGNHTSDGQGLSVLDSSNILLEGNTFHDLKSEVSVGRSEHVEVRDNSFTNIHSDGIDVANVRHVIVDGDVFTAFDPAFERGDYPDMIQVRNDGSSATCRIS